MVAFYRHFPVKNIKLKYIFNTEIKSIQNYSEYIRYMLKSLISEELTMRRERNEQKKSSMVACGGYGSYKY